MQENEIGVKATWDTKDFNKGQEEYSRGISNANKETLSFNQTILKLAKAEKELKEFEKSSKYFESMTQAEKDAVIAADELRKSQEKVNQEVKKAALETKKYEEAMARARKEMVDRFANGAISVGRNLTIGVTAPLVAAGAAGIKAFSDLNEAVNASNVTFRDASQVLTDYANTAAESVGLSKRAFLQASVPIGAQLQNMGYEASQAAEWTVNLTQRAADMASVFNTDVNDALAAIQSGLRGEVNPLERYGVGLSAAAVQAYALSSGLIATKREMTDQEKITARLGLLMEQTARVQGDFANTSDGLANSTRIAKAQLEDAAAALGEKLIPLASKGVSSIASLVDTFNKLSPAGQDAAIVMAAIAAGVGPVLIGVGNAIKAYQSLDVALKAANISMKTFTLTAGAWVLAIGAVVAAGVVTYTTFQKIEKAADNAQQVFTDGLDAMAESTKSQVEVTNDYIAKREEANRVIVESGLLAQGLALIESKALKNYQGLNDALVKANGSYDDYRNQLIRAAIANKDLNATFVETKGNTESGRLQIDAFLKSIGMLTQEQYEAATATDEHRIAFEQYTTGVEYGTQATEDAGNAIENTTRRTKSASDAAREYGIAIKEAADAVANKAEAERVAFAVSGSLQKLHEDYIQTLSDLTDEHDDLIDKKEDLLSKGYDKEGPAVQEINDALDENASKQDDAAAAADKATKALIYQTAVAGLDGDATAQLELARALGLVSEADYNLITATDEITKRYKETGDLDGYTNAMLLLDQAAADGLVTLDEIKSILDLLDGKASNASINIHTNYTQSGSPPPEVGGGGGAGSVWTPPEEYALGGNVKARVPIVVGEKGPELFVPSSAGEIVPNGDYKNLLGGDASKVNPLEAFTELDFAVFDDVKSSIQDAIAEMLDAGEIGEKEANELYLSLSNELINSLGTDTALTDEFFAKLTGGLGDLGDEVAEITRLQELWAAQEEVVTAAEKQLAEAEESGVGIEEAKQALLAAEEAENITEEKLETLKEQLDILKDQKAIENEIKQAEEEAAEEARKAAEEAAKALEEERQARIKAAEEAVDAAQQAKQDAEDAVADSKKRVENAQKELQRIADVEKEAARDAEIQKAKDAVDAAKSAIAEIEKAENEAQANKISATAEYNRLLRSGASKEELENAKAKIDAAQAQIDAEKQNKIIAEQNLVTEEEKLTATQDRIDAVRKEEDAAKFAQEKADAQKELEDAMSEQETAMAQLRGATIAYDQAYSMLRALLNPDMQFTMSANGQANEVKSMVESMAGIFGGFASERNVASITHNNTLSMPMTNQIASNMDAAQIIGLIRQTVQQTFARR